jgi:EmrB/QacA subfamily drug resistance transporter
VSRPELRVVEGPETGRTISLSASGIVGRDPSTEFAISDEEMSRRHARVVVTDGDVTVEDLGSLNGTFVNGKRLSDPHQLKPGDRIKLGNTVMELVAPPPDDDTRRVLGPAEPSFDVTRARAVPPRPSVGGELRVSRGTASAPTLVVEGSRLLGRDPECDMTLDDPEVSWRHARVAATDGRVTIEDLGSTNGTFVNGGRILERQQLNSGDRIELGSAAIEFVAPGVAVTGVRRAPPEITSMRQIVERPAEMLADVPASRKRWTLAVVGVASFMLLVDTTIVSVALTPISESLDTSFTQLQWVIDAYAVFLAAFLLTAGSLSDIVGRKQIFLIGLIVFTAASALCGFAWSALALDVFRGIQGIGGALMLGTSVALVAQEFPVAERGVAFGVLGAITGLGIASGPLVGGILTSAFGWESVFFVNVPVGVVAIVLTVRKLVNLPGPPATVDVGGFVTFSLATFLFVFGLIRGAANGWTSPLIVACLVGGPLLYVAFVLVERRAKSPMMDLSLVRIPTFNGVSLASFAMSASIFALIIYITLWLQSVLGYSALETGVRLLTITGLTLIFAPLGGMLSSVLPIRAMLGIGLGFMAAGIFLMTKITPDSSWTVLAPGLVLAGTGLGISAPAISNASVGFVPPWKSGMASGLNYTWRQIGLATGIAVLGAVFQHQVRIEVDAGLAGSPAAKQSTEIADAIAAGGTPGVVEGTPGGSRAGMQRVAEISYAKGLDKIFIIAGIVATFGGIAGVALCRQRDMIVMPAGGPPGAPGPPEPAPPGTSAMTA